MLQPDVACKEWAQSRLCTLGPYALRPGWGLCRLCNLLPAPGATRASLAWNLLVQGVGRVGMAEGLGMPPFSCSSSSSSNCQPAVLALTQHTPGHRGPSRAEGQPPQDQELVQACGKALSHLADQASVRASVSSRGPILPPKHWGFHSSHGHEGW